MHRIRLAVRENRLSDPASLDEAAYRPFVEGGSAWVAEQFGRLAGFAALDREAASVWALFVADDAQGFGIGRALHDHMIAYAERSGLTYLTLSTMPGSRADGFYRAAGWLATERNARGETEFRRKVEPRRGN